MSERRRKGKSLGAVLILMMLFTSLMPSWAYGGEISSSDPTVTSREMGTAAEPKIEKDIPEEEISYEKGEKAELLCIEASSSDGGNISYQWQQSTDGKIFSDIENSIEKEYLPDTDTAGKTYYRVTVTNTLGESKASAESKTVLVTVIQDEESAKIGDAAVKTAEINDSEPAGKGTETEPYEIENASQLRCFAEKVNGSAKKSTSELCAVLEEDIDISDKEWIPIGQTVNTYSDYVIYGGTFDGNGKKITGLNINNDKAYQAFIGYAKGATVKNLTLNGSVTTSTSGTSYAAGVISYGEAFSIENCVNNVNVTAVSKGYAAGIASRAGAGSSIVSCTNNGKISGCGDYVGGITATAMGADISNCFNNGQIVNKGKPSSYAYCTGGIAGGASSSSVISMCGNTAGITSTLKRTGGISGSLDGTIEKSFNTGNITGIYGVGGILGDSAGKSSTVESCYNSGSIKGISPVNDFNDTNAKGIGGIAGGVSGVSYSLDVKHCYNTGNVSKDTNVSDVTCGGVIGNSSGKNYSGTSTTGLAKAESCYYLESACDQGDGYSQDTKGISSKTSGEMKSADFAAELGGNFAVDPDGGMPILGWQDPNSQYAVKFIINPAEAHLTVEDSAGKIVDPSEGDSNIYYLKNGNYSYTVSCDEYDTVSGEFTVAYGGQEISAALQVKKYDYVFETEPEDIQLAVRDKDGREQTPMADGRTYSLPKSGNPYQYEAKAYGYTSKSGSFNVKGNKDSDKKIISLVKQQTYKVSIPFVKETGGQASDTVITVASKEYPQTVITAEKDGSFSLPNGNYTYRVSSAGYKSVSGEFTVNYADLTVDEAYLVIQTVWDGETTDEPSKDKDGVYLISTSDELMWFNKEADLKASAKLTADIRINESVNVDVGSSIYEWTPKGISSSKAYTGTFDGNGHTVSGLYINNKALSNTGFFGYVGAGGEVKNLTISDSIIMSSANYVGAVAGDSKGNITNCHTTSSVSVSGKGYIGGIVGELDSNISVSKCSNLAKVAATGNYAGGIAGRVYSNASEALTDSYNAGSVEGASFVGGITGSLYMGGTVEGVYSIGSVKASAEAGVAGGVVGEFRYGHIKNAYSAGSVSTAAVGNAGGIAGSLGYKPESVDRVYYLDSTAEEAVGKEGDYAIQNGSILPKTSDELKVLTCGVEESELGELFTADKEGINNGYPVLLWQTDKTATDPDGPSPSEDGWDGTVSEQAPEQIEGVYQLESPGDLKWFADSAENTPDIKGVLTEDVDLNNQPWEPIGGNREEKAFLGMLDGNGYTVNNLYIKGGSGAGLIAYNKGSIKNVIISGLIKNADNSGAVAGYNEGLISEVISNVTVSGGNYTSGISGVNLKGGTIIKCTNNGNVSGGSYVSGITASNKGGSISESVNTGLVTATGTFAAGIAADNTNDKDFDGNISRCVNSGHIISTAKSRSAFVGGIIGRNDSNVLSLYNTGNVVSRGSGVGGCVGINTVGSKAEKLYSIGDVSGAYQETESSEEFRVGGAVGEMVSGVSEAYYLNLLDIAASGSNGGEAVPLAEILIKAESLTEMTDLKKTIDGSLTLPKSICVGDTVRASYKSGNSKEPIFVWYRDWSGEQEVLAVSDTYTIPNELVGTKVYAKCMDNSLSGIVKGKSEEIEGFTGTAKINGYAVEGHKLTVKYSGSESASALKYQWYRGAKKIETATEESYLLTNEDLGKDISVIVSSKNMPGEITAKAGTVKTAEDAGIWPESQCDEPSFKGGVYEISSEAQLKWFVNKVNGGMTSADAQLIQDITLTGETWYPIGNNSDDPYSGAFDGKGKKITGLVISAAKDDQGLFGSIDGKGTVKNLNLSGNIKVSGSASNTGGIAGYTEGKIVGCTFSGSIEGISEVGGIAGQLGLNGKISQCRNSAALTGKERIGGITGTVAYGTVSQCINTGQVGISGTSSYVGGISGVMTNYAVVEASYNTAAVKGSKYKGGIAGEATVCAAPQGCYNIGEVESGAYSYGVLGNISGTEYITQTTGSYYLAEDESMATDKTATGVSSSGMKKDNFITLLNNQVGSRYFVSDSKGLNEGYPVLQWELTGASEGGSSGEEEPQPGEIKVSITLIGDTAHGPNVQHEKYYDWIEKKSYTLKLGSTALDLFKTAINDAGMEYEMSGNSYVSAIYDPETGINLAELTNGPRSGWMYTINGKFTDYMEAVTLKDGDDMRFFYVDDYSEIDWDGDKTPQESADEVEALIDSIPDVDKLILSDGILVDKADSAYNSLNDEAKALVSSAAKAKLEAAVLKINELRKENQESIDKIYADTGDTLLDKANQYSLTVGASHGDWAALGLARAGVITESVSEQYSQNVIKYVRKKGSAKLHSTKSTDNSRVILGLTSIGKDVTDVAGYNLLEPLADLDYVNEQGINGPIWALIALDSYDYDVPDAPEGKVQTTRDALISCILDAQLKDGGFSAGEKDTEVDITAMALQALAPYYDTDNKVKAAVDKALGRLSDMQGSDGKFRAYGTANAESNAQVIVALTSLGIDPADDGRFIKNGNSVMNALLSFYSNGSFMHTMSSSVAENGMATEQSYYALASYYRLKGGKTSLFDMTDVKEMTKIEEKGFAEENQASENKNTAGAEKKASGKTKSVKAKLTTVEQVMSMIEAVLNPDDPDKALPSDLSKLTEQQLDLIIEAYNAYDSLSDDEKLLVKNYTEFKELLDKLGKVLHKDLQTGIMAEDIQWHYRLVVKETDFDNDTTDSIRRILKEDSDILKTYDIYFEDLLTGNQYEPSDLVKIKIPKPDMKDFDSTVIVHVDDGGDIQFIKCEEKNGYIVFKSQDFSLYAVAGVEGSWNDLFGVGTLAVYHMAWIIAAAIAAFALTTLIIVKKRNKHGDS